LAERFACRWRFDSDSLRQYRLCLRQPERHVHSAVEIDGRGQFNMDLCSRCRYGHDRGHGGERFRLIEAAGVQMRFAQGGESKRLATHFAAY
jgi:hypothetical protein